MARTTHVAKAQQRYETVVVTNEDGTPKKTPVMRNGVQRTTKKGKPIYMTVTALDKSKPKDPYTCNFCHKPIEVGTPYKHISPKSGPYGGHKMTRHESCPSWQVWDYSNSLSARLARISHDFWNEVDGVESTDDVSSALASAAESIKEVAEEKRESASNIEEGFGHATSQSEELEQMADDLDSWADEVEGAEVPDIEDCTECDGSGEVECPTCGGDGEHEVDAGAGLTKCEDCEGTGNVDCEAGCVEGADVDGWRDMVRDQVTIVDESPV